jgi:hypothetical protein
VSAAATTKEVGGTTAVVRDGTAAHGKTVETTRMHTETSRK